MAAMMTGSAARAKQRRRLRQQGRIGMRMKLWLAGLLALAAMTAPAQAQRRAASVRVNIIAFNDFHGALEPPRMAMTATGPGGTEVRVPVGGAAYFATAARRLRAANPNSVMVAAGDL